jgi:hypothetical protein
MRTITLQRQAQDGHQGKLRRRKRRCLQAYQCWLCAGQVYIATVYVPRKLRAQRTERGELGAGGNGSINSALLGGGGGGADERSSVEGGGGLVFLGGSE